MRKAFGGASDLAYWQTLTGPPAVAHLDVGVVAVLAGLRTVIADRVKQTVGRAADGGHAHGAQSPGRGCSRCTVCDTEHVAPGLPRSTGRGPTNRSFFPWPEAESTRAADQSMAPAAPSRSRTSVWRRRHKPAPVQAANRGVRWEGSHQAGRQAKPGARRGQRVHHRAEPSGPSPEPFRRPADVVETALSAALMPSGAGCPSAGDLAPPTTGSVVRVTSTAHSRTPARTAHPARHLRCHQGHSGDRAHPARAAPGRPHDAGASSGDEYENPGQDEHGHVHPPFLLRSARCGSPAWSSPDRFPAAAPAPYRRPHHKIRTPEPYGRPACGGYTGRWAARPWSNVLGLVAPGTRVPMVGERRLPRMHRRTGRGTGARVRRSLAHRSSVRRVPVGCRARTTLG